MKILGRILLILMIAAFIGSAFYMGINVVGARVFPRFQPNGEQIRQRESGFEAGSRPDFRAGPREGDDEEGGLSGGLLLGMIKNALVVTFIVMVFVLPASLSKKKRLSASSSVNSNPSV